MTKTIRMLTMSAICASLSVVGAAAVASASPSDSVLNAEQIEAQIIGRSFQGKRMGMTAKISHKEDGSSILKLPFRTRRGTWEIQDDALCVVWGKAEEPDCVTFAPESADKFRVEPMGLVIQAVD